MKAVSLTTLVCFSVWTILHVDRGEHDCADTKC